MSKVRYIEELDEGWDKIIKEHREHPLKPKLPEIIADEHTMTVIIFSTKGKFEKKKIVIDLNKRQKKAIEYLKKHRKISNKEYRSLIPRISDKTVYRDLRDLVKKNLVQAKGKKKGRYYVFKE
ncbi:MAG: DeoR family transcriptional regulator [Candidatus Cloacimonetes bacterium]|nr:DeoR family transcriptional regulator [Candidatus Cloacimonadota bacterium]